MGQKDIINRWEDNVEELYDNNRMDASIRHW